MTESRCEFCDKITGTIYEKVINSRVKKYCARCGVDKRLSPDDRVKPSG